MYDKKLLYCLKCGRCSMISWIPFAIPDEPLEEIKCPNCGKKSLVSLKILTMLRRSWNKSMSQKNINTDVSSERIADLQKAFDVAIDRKDFNEASKILDCQCELVGYNTKIAIENRITLDVESTMTDEV